jgi:glycosyltransferase involved in cell wall biosynthesis
MASILHITCDLADAIDPDKTPAVRNLLQATGDLQHVIISLNRTVVPFRRSPARLEGTVYSFYYLGLPFGIGLRWSLLRTARRLRRRLDELGIHPDVVHSHKLTFEGPIGQELAVRLAVPFVCTVRGDTDLKLLQYKPGYRRWYRGVYDAAAVVFFVAPWARRRIEEIWPDTAGRPAVLLPNIVPIPATTTMNEPDRGFVSVFHLKHWRRKNVRRLLDAIDECNAGGCPVTLDIIGGGPATIEARIRRHVDRLRHPDRIRLRGGMDRNRIAAELPHYTALVLPSRRETFGMVYLEALRAGLPFLHSRNAGVDGWFDGLGISVAVDPESVASIADGIRRIVADQRAMRARIRDLSASEFLDRFDARNIAHSYREAIRSLLDE